MGRDGRAGTNGATDDQLPRVEIARLVWRRRWPSFDSVTDLKLKINTFVEQNKLHPKPSMCTATLESIPARIERLFNVLDEIGH